MARTETVDVAVVGCGVAGLSAAVSAATAGASVIVLERAPREDRGGNTRWTDAYLRMKNENEVTDDFESHFAENAGHNLDPGMVAESARDYDSWPGIIKTLNFSDPEVVSRLAAEAPDTLAWLKRHGVRFDFLPIYFVTQSQPRLATVGGGEAIVDALAEALETKGGRILYETTARALPLDEDGRVVGLRATTKGHGRLDISASSVVLACGGFEGNPAMLARYMGPRASYLRPIARGGYYNKGEGIAMALEIGAAPAGDFASFHAEPIDPRSAKAEPNVMIFPYGILVNRLGARFVDEAPGTPDAHYDPITRSFMDQPEGQAWAVFDAKLDDVPNWRVGVRSDLPPIEAATLPELAAACGIDRNGLEATVARFNAACPTPDHYDPTRADGLATRGLAPPKSNWSLTLDAPPFRAWPLMAANVFTYGGLKADPEAQVLNTDGDPIPGLYAAGEMTGLYYGVYTGATSVLRGAVYGRIAGENAARRARANTP